jgi:predicted nucleotidyltransferase
MSASGQMQAAGDAAAGARPMPERIPRAVLTRRLERLLARVDATPERVVERKKSLVFGIDVRGPVRVRVDAIWVFGSYARGALACGDVDMIIQSHMEWAGPVTLDGRPYLGSSLLPSIGKVISPVIGPLRKITFVDHHNYLSGGTILDGDQVARDVLLLWKPGLDWRSALHGIPIDPIARRAPRKEWATDEEKLEAERQRFRTPRTYAALPTSLRQLACVA